MESRKSDQVLWTNDLICDFVQDLVLKVYVLVYVWVVVNVFELFWRKRFDFWITSDFRKEMILKFFEIEDLIFERNGFEVWTVLK